MDSWDAMISEHVELSACPWPHDDTHADPPCPIVAGLRTVQRAEQARQAPAGAENGEG